MADAKPMTDTSVATRNPAPRADWAPPAIIQREALLDASENLLGYELRLDPAADHCLNDTDPGARLVAQLRPEDLAPLTQQRLLVVSVDGAALPRLDLSPLPRDGSIIAVRLPRAIGPDLTAALKRAWSQGYFIALDNFVASPAQQYLLATAAYVRLDVSRRSGLDLARESAFLLDSAAVRLIAGNLRTRDEFDACRRLPFDCYQGPFFTATRARPEAHIENGRAQVIDLLNQVRQRGELKEIEVGFRRDPTLSYRLLRYINSPALGLSREILSIAHALVVLGYEPLYRWLTLLLFTSGPEAARNRALLTHAVARGRLTELLGNPSLGPQNGDSLFVAGIFSMLENLLDIPLQRALAAIRLPAVLTDALLRNAGPYAPFLQLAIACEGLAPARVSELAQNCGIAPEAVNAAHFEALRWTEQVCSGDN